MRWFWIGVGAYIATVIGSVSLGISMTHHWDSLAGLVLLFLLLFGFPIHNEVMRWEDPPSDRAQPELQTEYLAPVHADPLGALFKVRVPRYRRPYTFVRVPLGDGKFRDFRVPATMHRATQAIAWTFGMRERDYQITKAT